MAKNVVLIPIPAHEDETSEEWGVLYPDGSIVWEGYGFGARYGDLRSREGQTEAQAQYDRNRQEVHAVEGGKLRFIKRTITVSYSLPVMAKAIRNKRGES